MQTISQILIVIMQIEGFKKNKELAELFGVADSTISTWKKRGTIPYEILFTLCEKKGWDYHQLLTDKVSFLNKVNYPYLSSKDEFGSLPVREDVKSLTTSPPDPVEQIVKGFTQLFYDQKKEFEKLHDMCEDVLERISALEKRAVGNAAAGSGNPSHTGDATREKES